ncbi:alpha/beta-hydrolase [Karstenula rhodostoma CBS 690.94]|uniref:Alpha/beta-hydrolase n=1 Tax=Karstenula rhodostoma CBS 690.94 TaxID=1392251 RepID=A0A9P4P8Y1_9PLEO|nr:alpha/beta-hydrolase [Karstenula rhodostoma CBS 690.94]
MTKPSIVIVPGSFTAQGIYQDVVDRLRAKGFPALAIDLLSSQKRLGLEPATMQDDAKHVRAVAETLIAQGKEVVVLCHSYGGVPTTQGLAGVPVKRIIYLTAVAPKVGETHAESMPGPTIDALLKSSVGGYMHSDPVQLAGGLGTDFDSWEYAYECALKLPHHSTVSFTEKVTQAAYETVPVSYIFTEKDVILTPEHQESYINLIEEVKGSKIDVIRKPWGHCPNWSQPEELIDMVVGEAEKK